MKIAIFLVFLILPSVNVNDAFTRLQRLEGTWIMKTKKGALYESWKKLNASELSSTSFMVREKDTVQLEKVRLIKNTEGIFYISQVENQNNGRSVSFKLISNKNDQFVFENKEHDFPNRIIYTFVTTDSLVARVEGDKSGELKSSDYYYNRVK